MDDETRPQRLRRHAVSVLHWGRDEPVSAGLALPDAPASRFRQVEQRMRTLFPGCTLDLQQAPRAHATTPLYVVYVGPKITKR